MKPCIFAIDFDGTMVDHVYPEMGEPVPGAVQTVKDLQSEGHKIMLWTMRYGKELEDAVKFFKDNDIILWGINENPEWSTGSNKQYAHRYIDDAALGCPLMMLFHGSRRPVVDWRRVRLQLYAGGFLRA